MGLLDIFHKKTFRHGVHPPEHKAETAALPIRRLPFPPRYVLPLAQHIGKPAVPRVRVGQEVVRGEPIADADGFLSVPIHAPVTGRVEEIDAMPTARGPKMESIVLRADPASDQQVLWGRDQDPEELSREELVTAVQATGLVGLGGAAFPSHAKLVIPEGHEVDTLVVNGCECEPYLTTDHRVMLERTEALFRGIRIVLRALGAERAVIGIEDNKPDAIAVLEQRAAGEPDIDVTAVDAKYPQGSERILVTTLLGREIPSGGHAYDAGVVVNNVGTLAALGELLPRGEGLVERVITVAGPGVEHPGNYIVPIGTPLRYLLEHVGYTGEAHRVILGGPMMGTSVASLDVPVTKGTSGLVVLAETAFQEPDRTYPCIQCGKCVEACPMHLNPSRLGRLAAKRQYEAMEERFHLNDCFECGSCAFVCPANIPLVQYFRIAKALNRERKEEAAA